MSIARGWSAEHEWTGYQLIWLQTAVIGIERWPECMAPEPLHHDISLFSILHIKLARADRVTNLKRGKKAL